MQTPEARHHDTEPIHEMIPEVPDADEEPEEMSLFEHGFNLVLKYSGAFDPFKEDSETSAPSNDSAIGSRFERFFGASNEQKLEVDNRKPSQDPIRASLIAPNAAPGIGAAQQSFFSQFNSGVTDDRFGTAQATRQQQDALLFRDAQQPATTRFPTPQMNAPMSFYGNNPYQMNTNQDTQNDDLMSALLGTRSTAAAASSGLKDPAVLKLGNSLAPQQRPVGQQNQYTLNGEYL